MTPAAPLLVQGVAFSAAALAGVALGVAADAYRALRRAAAPGPWVGHALDGAFVVCVLPVAAAGLLAANWGEARLYPLAGLGTGAALYLGLGSPVLLPAETWACRAALRAVGAVLLAATWPLRALVTAAQSRLRRAGPTAGPPGSTSAP